MTDLRERLTVEQIKFLESCIHEYIEEQSIEEMRLRVTECDSSDPNKEIKLIGVMDFLSVVKKALK